MAIKQKPKNVVVINMDIDGEIFCFDYDIPDVNGQVLPTDRNQAWLDEKIRTGLRPYFGRMIPAEG